MAQIAHSIVFIFFVLGCSAVLGDEEASCTAEELEKCSSRLVGLNETSQKDICNGILDEALKCYNANLKSCVGNETLNIVNGAIEEIGVTREGCKDKDVEPAESTCEPQAVKTCEQTLASAKMVTNETDYTESKCSVLNLGAECISGVLVNCLNEELKGVLDMMLETVKKNMTDLKCCDQAAIKKCPSLEYQITNQTVSQESCKKLADGKSCVVKELNKCEDANVKKPIQEGMNTQMEICESYGYPGSGATTKPVLVLVLVSCMAFLATLI